jgi:hypothetical protein
LTGNRLNPLTRDEAQRRHESREEYAALLGTAEAPSHVVSLVGPWVTVSVLDKDRREYLLYSAAELLALILTLVSESYPIEMSLNNR